MNTPERFDYTPLLPRDASRNSETLFEAIRNVLRNGGTAHAGAPVISERTLCANLGISRGMAHRVHEKLMRCGVLRRQDGGSTYYIAPPRSSGSGQCVGIVLPCEFSTYVGSERPELRLTFYKGIIDFATRRRLSTMIVLPPPIGTPPDEVADFIRDTAGKVCGLIHLGSREWNPDPVLEQIWDSDAIQQVFFAATPQGRRCGRVLFDANGGIAVVSRLLRELGHRKVAVIHHQSHPYAGLRYQLEFVDETRELFCANDIDVAAANCYSIDLDRVSEGIGHAIDDVRSNHPDIRAFWCRSDKLAKETIHQLKKRGLDIPGDYSVIGFNNCSETENTQLALTTVQLPFYECGQAAARMLLEMLEHPGAPEAMPTVTLPVSLIVRDSVGRNTFYKDSTRRSVSFL